VFTVQFVCLSPAQSNTDSDLTQYMQDLVSMDSGSDRSVITNDP